MCCTSFLDGKEVQYLRIYKRSHELKEMTLIIGQQNGV